MSPFQLHATRCADVAPAGSVDTFSVGHRALLRLDQYAARRWARQDPRLVDLGAWLAVNG